MSEKGKEWQEIYCWQVLYQHNGNYKTIPNKMFYACVRLSLTGILLFYKTMSLVNSEGYSKKPKPKIGGFRVEKKWGEKKRE